VTDNISLLVQLARPSPCTGRFILEGLGAAEGLVTDRETLPQMGRPLDLVGQRNGVIGEADPALAIRICEKLIGPEPELARALSLDEQRRRRDEGPVQVLFLAQQIEKGRACLGLGLVLGRKTGGCNQLHARSDLQAASPADDEWDLVFGVNVKGTLYTNQAAFRHLKDGGGVMHMSVAYVAPGQAIRLVGGLGPLQNSGVAGSLTMKVTADGANTRIDLAYSVGGYWQGGFDKIAPAVSAVLGEQMGRLKTYIDTGKPTLAK